MTRSYPDGQMGPLDDGEIEAKLIAFKGRVVIDFQSPIKSVAMPPDAAREFARLILSNADKAELQRSNPT